MGDSRRSMFVTWKYDAETDEMQNLRQAYDPITARSSQHQACNRCHEKKIKCSGEKDGCEHCMNHNERCEYTRSSSKHSRRGKNSHRGSSGSGREGSPSNASGSYSRPSGSRRRPSAYAPSTAATTMGADDSDGLLSQMDFDMLRPEDGFDLRLLSQGNDASGSAYPYQGASTAGHHGHHHHQHHTGSDAGYQQWAQQGYSNSMYSQSQYTSTGPAGQGYPTQSYGTDYEGYEQLDPRMWPPPDHR